MNFIENLISEDLIYAIGWTMIHSLWQGLLVAFFMLLAMYAFQNKSAKLRYEIASVSLFALFIMSICTFTIFYDNASVDEIIVVASSELSTSGAKVNGLWDTYHHSATAYFNQHLPLLVTIWLFGVAFFLLRLVGGLVFIQKLRHQQNQPLSPFWQSQLQDLLARIPLRKKIQLSESGLVNVPMVIGYLKPMILLPVGAVNRLSTEEVEAILAHEIAHVFRNDYLLNILLSFIEVLFYYHPAVWLISAHIRSERENCADDMAIKWCGNSLAYARALVQLEEIRPNVPVFAMPFSGSKNQLLHRIQRILNQPQNRSNIMEKVTATSMLLAAILFLSVSSGTNLKDTTVEIAETAIEMSSALGLHIAPTPKNLTLVTIETKNDTVPEPPLVKLPRQRIVQSDDDGEIEIELRGNKVTLLKIDGTVVPEKDYGKYEDQIASLIENIPPPPPAPPAPPASGINPPPPPPAAPAAPPAAPRMRKTIKVITSDDSDDNAFISIQSGDEPMQVIIGDGDTLILDESFIAGDSIIIIEQDNGHHQYRFRTSDGSGSTADEEDEGSFEFHHIDLERSIAEFQAKMNHPQEGDLEDLHLKLEYLHALKNLRQEELLEALALASEERASDVRDQAERMREEIQSRMEEVHAKMEERHAEMEERHTEIEERYTEMEERRAELEERRMKREDIRRIKQEELVDKLLADGWIKNREKFSFQINDKRMKVNGKKMSASVHQEYLDFLDKNISQNFSIYINKN